MDRLPLLLTLVLLSSACLGGGGYTFNEGMTEMNGIVKNYNNAQAEPELLRMRGELFDLYKRVDGMDYTDDVGALRLILLFRLNLYDGKMMLNAAELELGQFNFDCSKADHFELAYRQYQEYLFFSNEAAANLEALIETYPEHARRAGIDTNLVASIRTAAQRTQNTFEDAKTQVDKACGESSIAA